MLITRRDEGGSGSRARPRGWREVRRRLRAPPELAYLNPPPKDAILEMYAAAACAKCILPSLRRSASSRAEPGLFAAPSPTLKQVAIVAHARQTGG